MYREDYYEEDSYKKGVTDIYILKHRNGPIGHVEMMFKKEQLKFVDIEKNRKFEKISKRCSICNFFRKYKRRIRLDYNQIIPICRNRR